MNYELRAFDAVTLNATEAAWVEEASASPSLFPGDVSRIVTFARQYHDIGDAKTNDYAYGVFLGAEPVADSIVQIAATTEGVKLVKMLDCFVRPSIAEESLKFDQAALEKVVNIYVATIVGTFAVGDRHKANVIKVYGRNDPLLTTLAGIAGSLKEQPEIAEVIEAKIEGRWLVVRPKNGRKVS
ncbi:hypothetical protein [Zoogloea sp.]|uniref:hypothetical protein n=1 Tax=Zoogloea sp. TaxID=49181 RepID=UPI0035B24106